MPLDTDSGKSPIAESREGEVIDRFETVVRALLTILFFVALRLAEAVLFAIVVFQLGYALVTGNETGDEVKRFANRVVSYIVAIARYVTYQEEDAPFPFQSFPSE